MPATAALVAISALVAFVAGTLLDALLRRVPRVERGLPPGRSSPALAVATGAASAVGAAALTATSPPSAVLAALVLLTVVGVQLSSIDLRHRLLPNVLVVPAIAVGGVLVLIASVVDGRPGDGLRALLGGLALFAVYLVLALISPGGLGMGDVKFAAVIGTMLASRGWSELLVGAAAGFALAALAAAVLLLTGRARRGTPVPFGPMMLAGAVVVLALSP
ncbi:A24 family peptidase [Rathayibacter sp. SD072]|uniref:prepilin peptidase n=1 Tax=Rathayibacter sp. SD072 TaxID=2781731 RepID=UPI001A96846A|nr:A24 family peptidase [Rathayibacter sp. SD072]MBO0984271.1 prepilin peptidase [Rathayibacter sp. SD072]